MVDPIDLLRDLVDAVEVFQATNLVNNEAYVEELSRAREWLNRADDDSQS